MYHICSANKCYRTSYQGNNMAIYQMGRIGLVSHRHKTDIQVHISRLLSVAWSINFLIVTLLVCGGGLAVHGDIEGVNLPKYKV